MLCLLCHVSRNCSVTIYYYQQALKHSCRATASIYRTCCSVQVSVTENLSLCNDVGSGRNADINYGFGFILSFLASLRTFAVDGCLACSATVCNQFPVPVQELVSLLIQHKCPLEAHTQRLAVSLPLS